jgi:hypothetical protein
VDCAGGDDHSDRSTTWCEFFEIFLDNNTFAVTHQNGLPGIPERTTQAQRFTIEYQRPLYSHVKDTIVTKIVKQASRVWGLMSVLFLFSVPTTWINKTIIKALNNVSK